MPDSYTTGILNRVNDMPEALARKLLADVFLELRSVGLNGKTKEDAYKAIESIFKSEVVPFILPKL
ncbi:hypothetical protein J2W97_002404 [Paenibacillus jamilae]|nr:hypothetical protein [Paenibacillus jamilae]